MSNSSTYIGNELDLFSNAKNWKGYWLSQIHKYLGKKILEVGAGIGTNTRLIIDKSQNIEQIVCLEPDPSLANKIFSHLGDENSNKNIVQVFTSTISDLKLSEKVDSIIYIDVIEHILDDKSEVESAARFLKDGGYLIILVPAHNFLYSEFDKAIGHYRRYNLKMIRQILPNGVKTIRLRYLDSIGFGVSLANKMLLHQGQPKKNQILFWDRFIIPLSRIFDRVFRYRFGKSVLFVGVKQN